MNLAKIVLLMLLNSAGSQACLNVSGTTIDGGSGPMGHQPAFDIARARAESVESRLRHFHVHLGDSDAKELEGVEAVLRGHYPEALAIFQAIEDQQPGQYSIASNLGTTYELLGELELATKWIAEGMRRNPESHGGTEWLHLAILNARIKLKEDPQLLLHAHIVPVPDDVTRSSMIEVDGKEFPVDEVWRALRYQLHERVFFVKPPDPVVADLLYSFGLIHAATHVLESSVELLAMARDYGFQDKALLDEKIADYKSVIRFRQFKKAALIGTCVAGFVFFLVFAYRKKWFFLSQAAYKMHKLELRQRGGFSDDVAARL